VARLEDASGRSVEEAAEQIRHRTHLENLFKPIVEQDLPERWLTAVEVTDNGIDNSGRFIADDAAVDQRPDWLISMFGRSSAVEVQVHSEIYDTVSIKESKLRHAIDHGNSIMILRESHYLILTVRTCQFMLENLPIKSNPKIMGGKPSVILSPSSLQQMIQSQVIMKVDWVQSVRRQVLTTFEANRGR
jgi:hypothetical protein